MIVGTGHLQLGNTNHTKVHMERGLTYLGDVLKIISIWIQTAAGDAHVMALPRRTLEQTCPQNSPVNGAENRSNRRRQRDEETIAAESSAVSKCSLRFSRSARGFELYLPVTKRIARIDILHLGRHLRRRLHLN